MKRKEAMQITAKEAKDAGEDVGSSDWFDGSGERVEGAKEEVKDVVAAAKGKKRGRKPKAENLPEE